MSRPAIVSGSVMFSSAVSTGSRLKAWKMKPIFSRRRSVRRLSSSVVISTSSIVTEPEVGRSRPARQCIRVDLPDPDGPMIALYWPRMKLTVTPSRACTAVSPCAEVLVHVFRGDDRREFSIASLSVVPAPGRCPSAPASGAFASRRRPSRPRGSPRCGRRTTAARSPRAPASRIGAGRSTAPVMICLFPLSESGALPAISAASSTRAARDLLRRHGLVHEPDLLGALGRRRCGR